MINLEELNEIPMSYDELLLIEMQTLNNKADLIVNGLQIVIAILVVVGILLMFNMLRSRR